MHDERTPVEKLIAKKREGDDPAHQLSQRAMQYQRSLEGYLQAGSRPRWMERLAEIEHGTTRARRLLERAYAELRSEVGGDRAAFARRWRELAGSWDFGEVNDVIDQHNEWFPIERQLAIDPRTRDYVKINGRSYRRQRLDAAWVLEHFPPERDSGRARSERGR